MHIFNHRKISSRQQQDTFMSRISNDPYVDWLIMLVTEAVFIGIVVLIGYGTYTGVLSRLAEPIVPDTSAGTAVFDTAALTTVLDEFSDRAAERPAILRGEGVSGDPSL